MCSIKFHKVDYLSNFDKKGINIWTKFQFLLSFQDLDAINALMRTEVERKSNVGKRLLDDLSTDANEHPPTAKRVLLMPPTAGGVNQKLGLIVHERTGSGE